MNDYSTIVASLFTLSATSIINPPETAPVCIGDQLAITCNVTGNFLKWSINLFLSTGDESYSRILSTFSETTYLQLNNTQFTFSRVSPQSNLPLESVVLISPATNYLNGTVVNCTDTATGKSSSTIIKIIADNIIMGRYKIILIIRGEKLNDEIIMLL